VKNWCQLFQRFLSHAISFHFSISISGFLFDVRLSGMRYYDNYCPQIFPKLLSPRSALHKHSTLLCFLRLSLSSSFICIPQSLTAAFCSPFIYPTLSSAFRFHLTSISLLALFFPSQGILINFFVLWLFFFLSFIPIFCNLLLRQEPSFYSNIIPKHI
jgi:hypothetical protein